MIHWLKNLFETKNEERRDTENKLTNHQPTVVQVDVRQINKVKETKKHVIDQLKQQHKFASIKHASDCSVLHPFDARLDCRKEDCWKFESDIIVGEAYEVSKSERSSSFKQIKERDYLNDQESYPEL